MQANKILINDFTYSLPDERIARYPLERRDESQLLVYNEGVISKNIFFHLSDFVPPDGLLVANDTKVVQARLLFYKETGAMVEIFCLEPIGESFDTVFSKKDKCQWKCIVGNSKKWKEGSLKLEHDGIVLNANRLEHHDDWQLIEFSWSGNSLTFSEILELFGHIPIPPYLNRSDESIDQQRYQTIYSQHRGSVAAPTAGLHITPVIIEKLESKNIKFSTITLHVGAGTFKPVKEDDVSKHVMHTEQFVVSLGGLNDILSHLGNITSVGTTTLRTLESIYWIGVKLIKNGHLSTFIEQWEVYELEQSINAHTAISALINHMKNEGLETIHAQTQIMIVPGYRFRMVDRLITNFHQPQSTLLLLVAAFIGGDWRRVYDYALVNDFRFLSYGDGSLLNKSY